eukprot:3488657-Prymnesium_polylepis.1
MAEPSSSSLSEQYNALRACVRTNAEQNNALLRAERDADVRAVDSPAFSPVRPATERVEAANAETRAAREEITKLKAEIEALRSECGELREQQQKDRRALLAAEVRGTPGPKTKREFSARVHSVRDCTPSMPGGRRRPRQRSRRP